jgi:hypothetical protein
VNAPHKAVEKNLAQRIACRCPRGIFPVMKKSFLILILLGLVSCGKSPTEAVLTELKWNDDNSIAYCQGYKFTGTARMKHSDGTPKGEYPFTDGRMHGVIKEWGENGKQTVETNFEHGQRHGLNRYWNREGKLIKEQMYDHDKSVSVKEF